MLLIWGLLLLIASHMGSAGAIVFLIGIGATYGVFKLAQRYLLYLIRAGHVYAMTRYLTSKEAPRGSAYAYCQRVITQNFKTVNAGALMDALVEGAVKQIMRWLNRAESLFSFIPGADKLFGLVNMVLSTLGNYIDEAVLSYVFLQEREPNKWRAAADGVVLYAQSWKSMLKGAAKVVAAVWALRAAAFILFALIGSIWNGWFGLILGYAMAAFCDGAFVEPFATVVMIEQYYASIQGTQPSVNLYDTLAGASRKFRELLGNAGFGSGERREDADAWMDM
jgi:AcrR family transcriptional regulator